MLWMITICPFFMSLSSLLPLLLFGITNPPNVHSFTPPQWYSQRSVQRIIQQQDDLILIRRSSYPGNNDFTSYSSDESSSPSSFTETDSGLFIPTSSSSYNIPSQNNSNDAKITQLLQTQSKSHVSYQQVLEGIDKLFPPDNLDQRTALSRKDGYWPFITTGDEPPKEYVYGEFDVLFFAQVLDRAQELWSSSSSSSSSSTNNNNSNDWNDKIFCDLGSGTGRLVLAAAALHKWKVCRGVELLPGIHDAAVENLESCRIKNTGKVGADGGDSSISTTTSITDLQQPDTNQLNENSYTKWQDAYMQQYRNSIPNNDDWLKQLSNNFEEVSEAKEEDVASENENDYDVGVYDGVIGHDDDGDSSNNISEQEGIVAQHQEEQSTIVPIAASTKEKVIYPDNNGEYSLSLMSDDNNNDQNSLLPLAPIELSCGSFDDPYEYFGDSDCIFVFSTAMPSHVIEMISKAVGRQCKPGCIVITSEYPLPLDGYLEPSKDDPAMPYGYYQLELVEELTGDCWCTGGQSTVFFHRVIKSLHEDTVEEYDNNNGEHYKRIKPAHLKALQQESDIVDEAKQVGRALDSWGILPDEHAP